MGKIPLFALLLITASTYSFYANGKSNSLPRATLMQCKAINKAQVAALLIAGMHLLKRVIRAELPITTRMMLCFCQHCRARFA